MNHSRHAAFAALFVTTLFTGTSSGYGRVINFEDKTFADPVRQIDWSATSGFDSGGAFFNNSYIDGFWGGFGVSRATNAPDLRAGAPNPFEFNAAPGSGAGGSPQFGIAYYEGFTPTAPIITLAAGEIPVSIAITNTGWAVQSMRNGDDFAKKFGGTTGNDPDFFKLTISGYNAGQSLTGSVQVILADFTFANNAQDFILETWQTVDLTSLSGDTRSLRFTFTSSDVGDYGVDTPTYVAVDNLTVVPEPAAAGLLLLACLGFATRRSRA